MAIRISAKIAGVEELQRKFAQVESAVAAEYLARAVVAGALIVQNDAKARVPKRTGTLSRSIHNEVLESTRTKAVVGVGTDVEYAAAVEFGSGTFSEAPGASRQPITIRPRNKRALFWPGAPHPVKSVQHPGVPARPYLRPAVDENKDAVLREIADTLRGQLERVARR